MVSHISSDMLKSPCVCVYLSVGRSVYVLSWNRETEIWFGHLHIPFFSPCRVEASVRIDRTERGRRKLTCWGTEFVIGMAILGIQGRIVHWGYVRGALLAMRETLLGGDWRVKTPLLKLPSALESSGTCRSLILQIQVGDLKPAG